MAGSFSFTGFDGNLHTIPTLPTTNYRRFIIFYNGSDYRLWFFNCDIINLSFDDEYIYLNDGLDAVVDNYALLSYDKNTYFSYGLYTNPKVVHKDILKVVYVSEELLPFSDYLISMDCSIDLVSGNAVFNNVQTQFVLRSIIEQQENIPQNIFLEVFDILPVLLVVFISFIGIRKAITWLSSILHNS